MNNVTGVVSRVLIILFLLLSWGCVGSTMTSKQPVAFPKQWLQFIETSESCRDISGDYLLVGERWPNDNKYAAPRIDLSAFGRGLPVEEIQKPDYAAIRLNVSEMMMRMQRIASHNGKHLVVSEAPARTVKCVNGWWVFSWSGASAYSTESTSTISLTVGSDGALISHYVTEAVSGLLYKERWRTDDWTRFQRYHPPSAR